MDKIIDLTGKKIAVTGSASGIGRQACITLASLGAKVSLLDVSGEGMNETLTMMDYSSEHLACLVDLSDIESIKLISIAILEKFGKIDGLVHCAGISSRKPLNSLKREGFDKLMNINLYSFVELVKLLTKRTAMADGGSIVAMSSISSIRGYKAKSEYCMSKASLDAFIRCMALELAPRGIRINSIMAAEVLTPLAFKAREMAQAVNSSEFNAPLGPSHPQEVANMIAFLLSDATKTITGASFLIDGGATI